MVDQVGGLAPDGRPVASTGGHDQLDRLLPDLLQPTLLVAEQGRGVRADRPRSAPLRHAGFERGQDRRALTLRARVPLPEAAAESGVAGRAGRNSPEQQGIGVAVPAGPDDPHRVPGALPLAPEPAPGPAEQHELPRATQASVRGGARPAEHEDGAVPVVLYDRGHPRVLGPGAAPARQPLPGHGRTSTPRRARYDLTARGVVVPSWNIPAASAASAPPVRNAR